MSTDKFAQTLDKIQDQKLKDLLLTYRAITKPALLFEILDYLNVKIIQEKLGAIITNIELDPFNEGIRIYLGALVIDGELYTVELIVYNDGDAFIELMKSIDILLYRQEVS